MVPSPSAEPERLTDRERSTLLQIARVSITQGLRTVKPLSVHPRDYSPALQALGASFVTLQSDGQLRGCIGHLDALQPLVADVAENAFSAAFRDPRFPPLRLEELASLAIHISVLTPPEPLACASEAELLSQLRPGQDGLILEAGSRRGTFLPSVWESLPEPRAFLHQLKLKARLPTTQWPADLKIYRYQTEFFGENP